MILLEAIFTLSGSGAVFVRDVEGDPQKLESEELDREQREK